MADFSVLSQYTTKQRRGTTIFQHTEAPARKRRQSTYNYDAFQEADARAVFVKYDADGNGMLSPDELEDAMFDIGIRLTDKNIFEVRERCGAKNSTDMIGYDAFMRWYNSGPKQKAAKRQGRIDALTTEMKDFHLPWIRQLFAAADEDENGELDAFEFADFYPTLRTYVEENIKIVLPAEAEDIFATIDENGLNSRLRSDGMIEFEEFEKWFLEMCIAHAKKSEKAEEVIKASRVNITALMKNFGTDKDAKKKKKPKKMRSVVERFNYGDVSFDARRIFDQYDIDNSGTIDSHELDDMLFELGVKVTKENLKAIRNELGITKKSKGVDFKTFKAWWDENYGGRAEQREQMLSKLSQQLRCEYIPMIRQLFAEADVDKSGDIDRAEFEVFYPKLQEFLGYKLAPIVQCMNEMDTYSFNGGIFGDGLVQYEEFEAWFLAQELNRAEAAGN